MNSNATEYKRGPVEQFLRNWNELFLIPVALILWKLHVWFIVQFDPTAAVPDAGIFSFGIAAVVVAMVLRGFTWIIIRITFPGIHLYLTQHLEKELWQLSQKHRVFAALLYYSIALLATILLYKTGF